MTDPRPWPVVAVKALAVLAMGLYLLHLMTAGVDEQTTDRRDQVEIQKVPAKSAPVTIWKRHKGHCWRKDQDPLAEIPGHVIWERPDGRAVYSKALTGPALDTTFGLGDLPGRPIAFCI